MNILVIIPARGGSKGIPHKNVKELNGKPLICYSIDAARQLTTDENICVSTDDDVIIKVVEDYGLKVHFKRPAELATDCAGTNGVLLHAWSFMLIALLTDICYLSYSLCFCHYGYMLFLMSNDAYRDCLFQSYSRLAPCSIC